MKFHSIKLTQKDKDRFWSKVVLTQFGCWEWPLSNSRKMRGYGSIKIRGKIYRAHRVAYVSVYGTIPANHTLDHLCRNRCCVRPDHLEPCTMRENVLRGVGIAAKNAAKTHCKYGHEFAGEGFRLTKEGWKICQTCRNEQQRQRRKLKKSLR